MSNQEQPEGQSGGLLGWVFKNLGLVFSVLRWVKPTIVFKGQAFVTRFADVSEVLGRDWVFQVPYKQKMEKVTGGQNFFLGMQNTPTYGRDVSNMRLAVRRDDIKTKVVPFVDATCEEILGSVSGTFDVVQTLTRVVPTRLIGNYFGTPGWDETEFTDAASMMFAYLFYPGDEQAEKNALDAARKTRECIDQHIKNRKSDRGRHDDILERCLEMQDAGLPGMTDLDIRNNFIGLLIGAIPTTSKCAALTLDYLLSHPGLLADAQHAARAGDDATMIQYVQECIRLSPFAAGIQRICAEDYVVAQGSWRATKIPKGTVVLAATQSAMMDWRKIRKPSAFRLDRPDYCYLHFGAGLHTCFGQYINLAQIPGIVKAVLKREGLRRVSEMKSSGPFPTSLEISVAK